MKSLAKKQNNKLITSIAVAAILLLLPIILSVTGNSYSILVLGFIIIYVIAVSGLDVNFGYCGQISMGHAAYYCIGAYGSVMLHHYFGIPVIITMILASILAAVLGAIVAFPASKLVFHFLSLSTIAFAEIVYTLVLNSPGKITGNAVGMFTDPINIFGYTLRSNTAFYYFGLVVCTVFLLVKWFLVKSKIGRAWIAIRENEDAAEGMGVNVVKYKVMAFAFSAFYTGFAGAMYAHLVNYIGPDTFTMKQSVMFITMMLFGGTGSILGPIIGSMFILLMTESLRVLEQYQMLVFGVILLAVVLAFPGGILGVVKDVIKKIKLKKGGVKNVVRN